MQSFRYRGAPESSTLGQAFVLHPDELHDSHAGTPAGFGYRILYLEPRLIQDALEAAPCPLPFVHDVVSNDPRFMAAITPALADLETPLEDLHLDQMVLDLAEALAAADPSVKRRKLLAGHRRAVDAARAFLDASLHEPVRSQELEAITGTEPLRARPALSGMSGDEPVPIPRDAPPRPGPRADPPGDAARRCGTGRRLC